MEIIRIVKNLNRFILINILVILTIFINSCGEDPAPSDAKNLMSLVVADNNNNMTAIIDGTAVTFNNEAAAGTNSVTIQSITVSDNAIANKAVGDVLPVKGAVITVTAEDATTQNYTLTINVAQNTITGSVDLIASSIPGNTSIMITITGEATKVNTPIITEIGILVSTDAMNNLELTNNNQAPDGATKMALNDATILALLNSGDTRVIPENIPFSFTIDNLMPSTTYYFRGYITLMGGESLYTDIINARTTP